MLASRVVVAQMFVADAIRLIVAFPPGGQSDLIARMLAQALDGPLGVPIVVVNKSGAAGLVGVEFAAHAPPDGTTLLLGSASNLTIAPALDSGVRFDPLRDFVPIGRVARLPLVLAVQAGLPVTNVQELVAYARENPGRLTYASSATGVQFAIESLKAAAGIDILQVPYNGTVPALMDVLAGRIDLLVADVAAVAPHVRSGAIRAIANMDPTRSKAFPGVPTMIEQGFHGFESWQGLLAPTGTPGQSILRLQDALRQALASSEFRAGLEAMGAEPIDEPPAAFAAFLREELQRYRRLAGHPR
ncbi:MAG: Bug family tripartite tricarboxylate transporter substrate binding protein [Casimicrobiaceae bacterium]